MSACPECGEDTAHGHWPFCNTAVIDGLRQRAERAEAERDFLLKRGLELKQIKDEKFAELEAAQSTIADLQATVERMRGAIENAPHSMGCGYAWVEQTQPGCSVSRQDERLCDCYKRAALGDAS